MYTLDALKLKLNTQGYRFTPQRLLICQVFQDLPTSHPLSAEELHQLLTERGERMNLSTVYRNLKFMMQLGIVREVNLARTRKYYELNTTLCNHHHLVCVQCHQTIKFVNSSIIQAGLREANKHGMQMLDCQLTLHTICVEAREMGWPSSISNDWRCPKSIATREANSFNHQNLKPKTSINKKLLRRIELRGERIIVFTPKDEIENYQHQAKSITGWRLSREDKYWYFPLEKAPEVLNLFQGYEIDPEIKAIVALIKG
ncbi:transcriptional repressor [Chlorogloeopsis sp. ULAP01]|uniref:Fur family transcriptional regulator n=1 Tax=Chlorogloeopsis sp. ULAP01 TaxID=3056483 RepID=UPI0025AB0F89|nr:transcriptional repressor [Chlorogloeopsis sp. ULAP01]MDM9379778.1 transcriptional repressor [Chlorogloeopsis sp. ULAP01]